jgi:hypothetical protein
MKCIDAMIKNEMTSLERPGILKFNNNKTHQRSPLEDAKELTP